MVPLVETWEDIRKNLLRLARYRQSSNPDIRKYYRRLIKRGSCFIAYAVKGEMYFGPSRFIVYQNNTRDKRADNESRDEADINQRIESILKDKFIANSQVEISFRKIHSIKPSKKRRKYIVKGEMLPTSPDIANDLKNISDDKNIKETVKRTLIDARLGQGKFRKKLTAVQNNSSTA